MAKKRISIKNGVVCGFADEVTFNGLSVSNIQKQRVSRIVPVNFTLQVLFYVIRAIWSDTSP